MLQSLQKDYSHTRTHGRASRVGDQTFPTMSTEIRSISIDAERTAVALYAHVCTREDDMRFYHALECPYGFTNWQPRTRREDQGKNNPMKKIESLSSRPWMGGIHPQGSKELRMTERR